MWTQTFARWMKYQKAYDTGDISDLFLAIEGKRERGWMGEIGLRSQAEARKKLLWLKKKICNVGNIEVLGMKYEKWK